MQTHPMVPVLQITSLPNPHVKDFDLVLTKEHTPEQTLGLILGQPSDSE